GAAPLAKLVAPGGVELRPAQAVGVVSGEHLCNCAVAPDELIARYLEAWALGGVVDRQKPRHTFEHYAADLADRLTGQGDAVGALHIVRGAHRTRSYPFGAGACLARASPTEHEPSAP